MEGVPKSFVAQTKGDILGDFDHTHLCGRGGQRTRCTHDTREQ